MPGDKKDILQTEWLAGLPTLLLVLTNNDHTREQQEEAREDIRIMAVLADAFGKEMEIEVFPMDGDSICIDASTVAYYDILVRPEGGDPILEFENLTEDEANQQLAILEWRCPGFAVNDLRELVR